MSGLDPDLARRLAEALIFASVEPVTEAAIADLLAREAGMDDPVVLREAARAAVEAVAAGCAGRGVVLAAVAGGWQFRTAPDLAPRLTRVLPRPRRLPRAAMETLAIIAYHQPCTRAEIEAIRGVSLNQATLDLLLEASLIVPRGRRDLPGRPILWATGSRFLPMFGLRDLAGLPRREELLLDLPGAPPAGDGPETSTDG